MYAIAYLHPQSGIGDLLGPGLGFLTLALFGALVGWHVGFLVWLVMQRQPHLAGRFPEPGEQNAEQGGEWRPSS